MKETMLILHFIGLAMGVGTGFAMMFLGIAASKMEQTEAQKFMQKTMVLSNMGKIGLVILIASGFGVMGDRWAAFTDNIYFWIKMGCVALLAILIGLMDVQMRKVRKGDAKAMQRIGAMGRVTLPVGIIIVIMAVLTFG